MEEDGEDSDYEASDANVDSDDRTHKLLLTLGSNNKNEDMETRPAAPQYKMKNPLCSPTLFSPITSPQTSSPNQDVQAKIEPASLLRLKSIRVTDSTTTTSLPVSPCVISDCSISSAESDGEVIV